MSGSPAAIINGLRLKPKTRNEAMKWKEAIMKHEFWMKRAGWVGMVLLLGTMLAAQTPLLKIVSPPDGTVVAPGQTVTMEVKVNPMAGITTVSVGGPEELPIVGLAFSPPYRFTFTIPEDMPLQRHIFTAGGDTEEDGEIADDSITLDVEKPNAITSLKTNLHTIYMVQPNEPHTLEVMGTFDDGSKANLTESTRITYTSDNPEVATVNSVGEITSVGPGRATITVSAGSVSAVVSAIFFKPSPPAPKTAMVLTPPPNAQGWNNSDIQVNVTSVDDALGSGIRKIGIVVVGNRRSTQNFAFGTTTASTVVSTEGDLRVNAYAINNAGNLGNYAVSDVHLDKTPPSIDSLLVPCTVRIPDEERRVIVATISASDALSGLAEFNVEAYGAEGHSNSLDVDIAGSALGPRTVELTVRGWDREEHDRARTFHLRARARDVAGNVASQDVICTVVRSGSGGD